jgi:hypothetical protein
MNNVIKLLTALAALLKLVPKPKPEKPATPIKPGKSPWETPNHVDRSEPPWQ